MAKLIFLLAIVCFQTLIEIGENCAFSFICRCLDPKYCQVCEYAFKNDKNLHRKLQSEETIAYQNKSIVDVFSNFSQQEELPETEKIRDEVLSVVKVTPNSELSNNDDHWFKEEDDKLEEEWTEEDEKWLEEIQGLLEDSDEDYHDDLEELAELLIDIENWIRKSHPEKKMYKWLIDIIKWFDDFYEHDWDSEFSHFPDYIKKEKNIKMAVDEKDNLDLYYSWLYQTKLKNANNEKVQPTKRFSSV